MIFYQVLRYWHLARILPEVGIIRMLYIRFLCADYFSDKFLFQGVMKLDKVMLPGHNRVADVNMITINQISIQLSVSFLFLQVIFQKQLESKGVYYQVRPTNF